jgi:hypothetical protein
VPTCTRNSTKDGCDESMPASSEVFASISQIFRLRTCNKEFWCPFMGYITTLSVANGRTVDTQ